MERGAVDMESREYVNLPMIALLETMRHRACPRPDIGDEDWIRVIECMEETIRFAEECWNNTDCDYELWEEWRRKREDDGEELVSIMP